MAGSDKRQSYSDWVFLDNISVLLSDVEPRDIEAYNGLLLVPRGK